MPRRGRFDASEGRNKSTIKAMNVKAARTLTERRQMVAIYEQPNSVTRGSSCSAAE